MIFNLPDFENKDVVFVGRGKEGQNFKKFIQEQNIVRSFEFVDEKDDPGYLEDLKKLDMSQTIVVKTPGCPGRNMTVPYTTPTRVFFDCAKQLNSKIVGITGTKGKTTTSSLLHFTLKNAGLDSRLCGNVGEPMLETLDAANENTVLLLNYPATN
jgi:UDP-N-acetylmuramoyl-L-alanine---L-glutamate ligase